MPWWTVAIIKLRVKEHKLETVAVMLPYTDLLRIAGAAKSVLVSVKELCLPASGVWGPCGPAGKFESGIKCNLN